jgi:hypothetical protein
LIISQLSTVNAKNLTINKEKKKEEKGIVERMSASLLKTAGINFYILFSSSFLLHSQNKHRNFPGIWQTGRLGIP